MAESNINLENTAFFDNVTWLNQANWQNYFGKTLPNGVIVDGCLKLASNGYTLTGTMDVTSDESNVIIGTGAVMANGLYAENNAVVQIPHVTSAESTKLICVKFDLAMAKASIITKTSVLDSGANVADAITALNLDESYLCTRNTEVYEIPLAFDTYAYGTIDLRRLVYAPSGKKHHLAITTSGTNQNPEIGVVRGRGHCQLYGGTAYNIAITNADSGQYFDIYPIFPASNEPIIIKIDNLSGSYKNIVLNYNGNQFHLTYEWTDSWQTESFGKYLSLANNTAMVIVLVPCDIGSNGASYAVLTKATASGGGGDIDPETIYTKQEINAMMDQKASLTYVNTELAKKEFTTNLKDLAYQDKVDYLTQVNNIPTLGALADHNTVNYITEVTNKPSEEITVYVDTVNGIDSPSRGKKVTPFKTVQYAVDFIASRGTIILSTGSCSENIVIPHNKFIEFQVTDLSYDNALVGYPFTFSTTKWNPIFKVYGTLWFNTGEYTLLGNNNTYELIEIYGHVYITGGSSTDGHGNHYSNMTIINNGDPNTHYCISVLQGGRLSVHNKINLHGSNGIKCLGITSIFPTAESLTVDLTHWVFEVKSGIVLYGDLTGDYRELIRPGSYGIIDNTRHPAE